MIDHYDPDTRVTTYADTKPDLLCDVCGRKADVISSTATQVIGHYCDQHKL